MKLTKLEQWILDHPTPKGTVRAPNARKASRDAFHSLIKKGLVVQEERNGWYGGWPVKKNPPSKAEQMIRARMMEIRELVQGGATEMVGKSYRGASGKIEGRHKGGFTKWYPELNRAGLTPGEASKAVALGKGKRYARLHQAIADTLGVTIRSPRKRGPLKVVPHAGIQSCRHCRQLHTTSEHRFHGPGAFHRTHAFSFNPKNMKKNPTSVVVIYGKVLRIEAQKTQKHRCDEECKQVGHRYYHDFKVGPIMYGLPDGSLLIKARK